MDNVNVQMDKSMHQVVAQYRQLVPVELEKDQVWPYLVHAHVNPGVGQLSMPVVIANVQVLLFPILQ